MTARWHGVIDPRFLKDSHVETINMLADAARDGSWEEAFRLLDSNYLLDANQWRISGSSWFSPLHQAAWLGASVAPVEELIRRGAWRSLRNADGERPVDIARKRGHNHLVDLLEVRELSDYEQDKFDAWNGHLTNLIHERTEKLKQVEFRPIPTEVIALEPLETLHFAYPGMYGGFSSSIFKDRLFVESWSRVVGGSGQAHIITAAGCVLVEEGFV